MNISLNFIVKSKGRIFYTIFEAIRLVSASMVTRNYMRSWPLLLNLNGCVENAEVVTPAESVDVSYRLLVPLGSYVAGKDIFTAGQSPAVKIMNFFYGVEF